MHTITSTKGHQDGEWFVIDHQTERTVSSEEADRTVRNLVGQGYEVTGLTDCGVYLDGHASGWTYYVSNMWDPSSQG